MDLLTKCFLSIKITFIFLTASCCCTCHIDVVHVCTNYTITCVSRPTSVNLFSCSYEPDITFIIKDSTLETLTSGFFSSTNFDYKVKYVESLDNDWKTIEKHAFKFYPKTLSLNLSATGIININKEAFLQLTNLKNLDLSNNKIETLFRKSLYIEADNDLEILDLSRNKLTNLDTDLFSSLTKLIQLYIQNNEITSMSIDCFHNLKRLTILLLQNNNLTSFSSDAIHLKELTFLDLSNNKFKKLNGFETSRLTSLVYFNISNNTLEDVDLNCFSLVQNLEYLDLRHNVISSSIEAVMFINNRLLRYLNLFDNKITSIKDLSFQFNSIQYINLEHNKLSINITRDTVKGLFNIITLNITQQNITAIKERAFIDMQNLQYLNLSKNNIGTVDSTSFKFENKNALIIIDFSFNSISDLYFLRNFTSDLKEFYINNNKLTVIRTDTFKTHKKLIKLDVSENEIILIEHHSLPLANLQYLHVNKNNLTGNITRNIFSPAPVLRYLDVDNLKFQRINENAFEDLKLLTKLNLSNNELEYIDSNNFINMEKMYSLDLSHNKLSEFSAKTLNKLKAIYLNNNYFKSLPKLFSKVSEVSYIDVSNNFISDLGNTEFENVRNVTVLKMSNNGIKVFNSEQTNKFNKLSQLILSSNQISEIKLSYFKGLLSLDLSNNSLSFISDTIVDNLQSLQYLDFSVNNLSMVSPGSFQHLKNLKFLNLSSNYITDLHYGSLKGLAKTEAIDLSRNKIISLDVNIFHECNELKRLIIDYNFIKTIDVDKLIYVSPNMMSLSLGGNQISCEAIVRNNRLKDSRKFEVTSMHQIFHEDNVHGIKCGDTNYSSFTEKSLTTSADVDIDKGQNKVVNTISIVSLTLCFILTIFAILAIAYFIYLKCGNARNLIRERRAYSSNSLNRSSGDYNNDLLS